MLSPLAVAPPSASAATPQTSLSEISSEVMCPVCGTLLELAESPQALREKAFVSRWSRRAARKEQIKDALVAEYGNEVLALPRGSGFNLSAYLVPMIAFASRSWRSRWACCDGGAPAGSRRRRRPLTGRAPRTPSGSMPTWPATTSERTRSITAAIAP